MIRRAAAFGALALVLLLGTSAAAAAASGAAPVRKDAGPIVDSVFHRSFAFCRDPHYALTPAEVEWCVLMPKQADSRCPHIREACGQGATAVPINRRERAELLIPGLSGVFAWMLWALLGVGAGFVLIQLIRQRTAFSLPERVAPREDPQSAADEAAAAHARAIETDVERLLAQARRAAAAGDFRAAIDDVYAALLRKLEGGGVLSVEAHRTNGDHVRDVSRKQPALLVGVDAVVTQVERVQFGGDRADEASFRAIHDGVVGLLGQRLAQVLPFVAALALAAVGIGCVADRGQQEESPTGRAAVLAFLQQYGMEARDRLLPLAKIEHSVEELVILPGATVDKADWEALDGWVVSGGTLLVAGAGRELPAWIAGAPSPRKAVVKSPVTVATDQASRFAPVKATVPPGPDLQLEAASANASDQDGPQAHPLLMRGSSLYAVEQIYDEGRVVLLADDSLFTNASLLVSGNAQLLGDLLIETGKRVELAGDLTGLVATTPLASVQRGQLAPALLQLAVLALLFFAYRGAHFGRPLDPETAHRRAFSEHVRALGLQYARRRAGRHALEIYGTYALERMRERLHLGASKSLLAVAEAVAARTGRPVAAVMRLLVEAHPESPGTKSAAAPTPAAEDLATLREIATLLTATGGAGERTRGRGQA